MTKNQTFSHPGRPNLANIRYFIMRHVEMKQLEILTGEAVCFCSRAVRFFLAPIAQMCTALIWDFYQQSCKEKAHSAVWVI